MLGGTGLTNWPIAEWRVPTNDPGSLFEVATCYELMVTWLLTHETLLNGGPGFCAISAISTVAEESPESDHNVETSFKRELRSSWSTVVVTISVNAKFTVIVEELFQYCLF